MVRFLISDPSWGTTLIRGSHLFEDNAFSDWVSMVQHLLERWEGGEGGVLIRDMVLIRENTVFPVRYSITWNILTTKRAFTVK